MRNHTWMVRLAVLLAGLVVAGAAAAQNMPKLPPDITLAQSGDSPGKVVFSHQSHVGYQAKADCTVCHPRLAPIVKTAKGVKRAPITHAAMLKGQACGACHGKDAHNFDDCTTCHK
jgi:c(7)-type cytochrome triheme protein